MSGAGQVETDGGGGTQCDPGARCAHNLAVKGMIRIRMGHLESMEDTSSLMAVKGSHPKRDDMRYFF